MIRMGHGPRKRIEKKASQSGSKMKTCQTWTQIAVPGWKVFKLTHDLCERPRPSPRPRMAARRTTSARMLRSRRLRLRPAPESQCGRSHRADIVRLTVVASSPGASLSTAGACVANVFVLLKMLFLGREERASQSGTSCDADAIEEDRKGNNNYEVLSIAGRGMVKRATCKCRCLRGAKRRAMQQLMVTMDTSIPGEVGRIH